MNGLHTVDHNWVSERQSHQKVLYINKVKTGHR